MKQEDKELLLRDFCSRQPYGVKGRCEIDASYDTSFDTVYQLHKFDAILEGIKGDLLFVTPLIGDTDEQDYANEEVAEGIDILDFKPYLRPLSSMTEEEKKDLLNCIGVDSDFFEVRDDGSITDKSPDVQDFRSLDLKWVNFNPNTTTRYVEWLLKGHFDFHRKYDEKDGKWKTMIELGLALPAPKGMYD